MRKIMVHLMRYKERLALDALYKESAKTAWKYCLKQVMEALGHADS
jgi:hypothetical protein